MKNQTTFAADRIRGLYAITPEEPDTHKLLAQAEAALKGGVSVMQYRNKSPHIALKYKQATALLALTNQYQVPLIINDHAQIAWDIGAAGVHVGIDDTDVAALKIRYKPPFLIGASCYNQLELAKAAIEQGADYIAFGRFYPSMTKPGDIFADTSLIAAIKSIVDIPVVGIGGITVDNAAPLIEAGLDAIAVISALFSPSQTAVSESCYEKIKERAAAFSSLFR